MTLWMGVAFADSHGADGNATSTDSGLDDSNATSTDPNLDDLNATSTDSIEIAAEEDDTRRKGFVGLISGFATTTVGTTTVVTGVTLTQKGTDEPVSIDLGSDVQVKLPGGPNAWTSLEDAIQGGAEIVILSRQDEDGNEAIFVLVKPKRPTFTALVGTVLGTEDGVTTIVLPNGKSKKIKKPEGEEDPEDGEVVTVFIDESGDGEGTGDDEPAEVTGLVRASMIADRIQSFLEKLAAKDASLPQAVIDARQRLVTNLAAVLDKHSAQQVSIIEKVSKAQGLGSGTAAGLQKALEKAQADRDKGKAIADDAKSKVGVAQGAGESGKGNAGSGDDDDDDDGDSESSNGSGKPSDKGQPANAGTQSGGKGGK